MAEHLTLVSLRKALSARSNVSEKVADDFLASLTSTIQEGLQKDGSVTVNGLGTFKLQDMPARQSVNVTTGERITIAGHKKVVFVADNRTAAEDKSQPARKRKTAVATEPVDPIQKLGEQAEEIKGILSELNAMTSADRPQEEPADRPLALTEERPQAQPAERPLALTEDRPQEEPAERAQALTEDRPQAEPADRPLTLTEERPQAEPAERPLTLTEERPQAEPAEGPLELTEDRPQAEPADRPLALTEDRPQAEPAERAQALTEDRNNKEEKKQFNPWMTGLITIGVFAMLLVIAYFILRHQIVNWADSMRSNIEQRVSTTPEEPAATDVQAVIPAEEPQPAAPAETTEAAPAPVSPWMDDSRRQFTEFLPEETVGQDSRLAWVAKKRYGEKAYWVFIYEVNRDRLSSPDHVQPGMKLRVPKLPNELRNPNDPDTKALLDRLSEKYLKEH